MRDQTAVVTHRYRRKAATKTADPPKPRESNLPWDVAPSLEVNALYVFFTSVVLRPAKDWRTSHGHLDFLLPLHLNAACDSALALATSWVAVMLMGITLKDEPYPLENVLFAQAITKVMADVADPLKSMTDETLSAVIMLQYGEDIRSQRYKRCLPSPVHQDGAEALVKKRRALNFRDEVSKTLFAAVRNNAVSLALSGQVVKDHWDMWRRPGSPAGEDEHRSINPAMDLDAYGVTLVALSSELKGSNKVDTRTKYESLRISLSEFQACLNSWCDRVPPHWLPQRQARLRYKYTSMDVAYLFCQWYLLKVETSFLQVELEGRCESSELSAMSSSSLDCITESVDDIVASEIAFLYTNFHLLGIDDTDQCINPASVASGVPAASVQQCRASRLGVRWFDQILDRLYRVLSKNLWQVAKDYDLTNQLLERINWAERERGTIRKAFPIKDV